MAVGRNAGKNLKVHPPDFELPDTPYTIMMGTGSLPLSGVRHNRQKQPGHDRSESAVESCTPAWLENFKEPLFERPLHHRPEGTARFLSGLDVKRREFFMSRGLQLPLIGAGKRNRFAEILPEYQG